MPQLQTSATSSRRSHPRGHPPHEPEKLREEKPEKSREPKEPQEPKEPPPANLEQAYARGLDAILRSFPKILKAQIDKAEEGSHLHAKLLFDLAGQWDALAAAAAAEDDSLASLLLKKLQIQEADDESHVSEQTPLL
jgi:hypothetical protein